MNGIYVRDNENLEKALRRFTRTCDNAGVLSEVKSFKYYEKPCEERKRKLNSAKRRRMKDDQKSVKSYESRNRR